MSIDAGNFQACLGRIAAKGKLGAAQALDLLEQVAERGDRMRRTGTPDPFVAAAHELAQKLQDAAKADRLDALRNGAVRNRILAQVDRAGGIASAETTLRGILHGTNTGGRDSVESAWKGNAAGWQAQLSWQLRKAGVEKAAISGELDKDIAREMWGMNAGTRGAVTGNNPARAVAEAIQPLLDHVRDRLNAAGARIGDAVDYVAHTTHDPEKMRRAAGPGATPEQAFAAWWQATEPKLAESTFADVTAKDGETASQARARFGKSVFDALVSGVHMTADGAFGLKDEGGYVPPAFEGSGNLARKLSQQRVLHWQDGEAWNAYMKQFGVPRSLTEGVMMTLDKSARQLALLEKLGTNPAANLNQILRRIQETYRGDLDGVKSFQSKIAGLEAVMAHLDGSANIPINQMWSRLGAGIRTWESMSSLGGVGVTHFASIWPTVTSEMVHHGESRLGVLGKLVQALVKGRGSEERQAVVAELGAYANGLTRDMHSRWQAEDPVPGRISALANTFMKYTGIHYVFDNTQAAVREMLANRLARDAGKGFGELEPHLAQILDKYGIGAGEWDLLRTVRDLPTAEGNSYLTPKDALRIDPAAAEALLRARGAIGARAAPDVVAREVGRLGQGLADKLYAYYGDAASHAVVTPGVRERAMVLGQDRPGGFGGELRRFMLQFKMWPLAAMHQIIGREIHMSLSKGDAAWNLGILAALSTAGGYLRMAVNDAALGHPLRDPRNPATLFAALAQGGGVGVLGDFLFGEANRFGGGLVGTLGGPAVGDVDQTIKIFNEWKRGAAGWPDIAHLAVRHVPFANLVYLKGALDYMLWYHLYEAASPGWWERTNRRLLREQGRSMTGYTPGAGVPWTPWGIGRGGATGGGVAASAPIATSAPRGALVMPRLA